jgi:chemotaxis protein histidine kinase CheA
MHPEQQQRILGYFIEEARDHLNTIEQGLLNLQETLDNSEMINEVFYAAHSIKTGAAMLGLSSIQHTSDKLEDCFKILKDRRVNVDQKLESLLLAISDTLKVLLDNLGSPFSLSDETANSLIAETEPLFIELNEHLEKQPKKWSDFQAEVLQSLREMLQLFKQSGTASSREKLQLCCQQLLKLGEKFDLPNWCKLCESATKAIANRDNSYLTLAKIIITEIKQAEELVIHDKEIEITISQELEALELIPELELLELNWDEDGLQSPPEKSGQPNQITTFQAPTSSNFINSDMELKLDLLLSEVSEDLATGFPKATGVHEPAALRNINTNDYDLNSFWIDTEIAELNTAELAKDAAKELEESLFASFEETVANSQQEAEGTRQEAGMGNYELVSRSVSQGNITNYQLSSEEDDLFADLASFYPTPAFEPGVGNYELPSRSVSQGNITNYQLSSEEDDLFADLASFYSTPAFEPGVGNYELRSRSVSERNITNYELSSAISDEFRDLEELLKARDQTINLLATEIHSNSSKVPRPAIPRNREESMNISVKQLDDLSNLVGELVISRNKLEQDHERLRLSLDNLLIQIQNLSDVGSRMQELYERSLLEASLLSSRRSQEQNYLSNSDNRGFTELEMDHFTLFHSLSQETIEYIVRVRESASEIDFVTEETEQVARQFSQVTSQLQEKITKARMVSFAQTVDHLRWRVRDNGIKYGKQVELIAEGLDTLVDKMILDHLTDPLTHIINNAIAHGIETPEKRIAAGKSPVGTIKIRVFHQGNQTVITINDDGIGIDHETVIQKAIQKRVITLEESRTVSRQEIYKLLYLPIFSTADEIDNIKGWGVGMNVVQKDINEIRGTVTTDSVLGKGSTFTIRLPLTLSICKALCCISDKSRIAFPMDGVEDTLDIKATEIQKDTEGQTFISWRQTVLPFRPLREILVFNRQIGRSQVYTNTRDEDIISVVVLRSGNTMVAIQVDQVLSEQEIVIKQLEGPAPKPSGVAGATILGDGRIMPIGDVLEIIDIFQSQMSKQIGSSSWYTPL